MKIKKGDNVKVLSGNDKGKTGEVLEVIPKADKIVVKGVNVRKKHVKARKQGDESGIIAVECSIPAAKVNVVCSKCGKATKVGYKVEKDERLAVFYSSDIDKFSKAEEIFKKSLSYSKHPPEKSPLILARVTENKIEKF